MLTEDYVSYEVAKLLKEKGFDIPCKYAWHGGIKEPDFHRHSRNFNGGDYKDLRTKWYSSPTHQMAMKWLRDKDIDIVIIPLFKFKGGRIYLYEVHSETADLRTGQFDTYEEAVEAALKYCLTYLI